MKMKETNLGKIILVGVGAAVGFAFGGPIGVIIVGLLMML